MMQIIAPDGTVGIYTGYVETDPNATWVSTPMTHEEALARIRELEAVLAFYAGASWSQLDDDLQTIEGFSRPGRRAAVALGRAVEEDE